jgi:hypothetical protein
MHLQSINILKQLYEQSDHPRIKSGELYVALFSGCMYNDQRVNAVGLFKTEGRDTFLRFIEEENGLKLTYEFGLNAKSTDKGCLILNVEGEEGYRLMLSDANSTEAQFWIEDFLQAVPINDSHFQTKNYMMLCRDFSEEIYAQKEDKKEQVMFLNKSLDYFSNHEVFDMEEFSREVIRDEEYAEKFRDYRNTFENERGVEVVEEFTIVKTAVKNMKGKFRSLIKLDTDIEIRINPGNSGNSEQYVERGYDEARQMQYYKLYFNRES